MSMASSAALARELGISYRQLDHWARVGYLRPVEMHPGSGRGRIWPANEYAVAALIVRLKAAGFELATAAELARELVAEWSTLGTDAMAEIAPGIALIVCEPATRYDLELELERERPVETTRPL
jgi:DNA-binding transcriptional MerR regulator